MTKRELLAELDKLPDDSPVVIVDPANDTSTPLSFVRLGYCRLSSDPFDRTCDVTESAIIMGFYD